jgi:hypothetical protein
MLHDMEATAIGLHYDCLHPAFKSYWYIATGTKAVVERFRTHRASFITNRTALEDARRELEDAAEKVRSLIVRYRFMEKLVKEWRGRPQIGKKFEEEAADQKWTHGIVSTDARGAFQVPLTDGTMAFQVKIEGKTRNILPCTQNLLRFECREINSLEADVRDRFDVDAECPSTSTFELILSTASCHIVGWTLSCRTKQPGPKSFSVISGGILRNELKINVKAPIFREANWRCRIYFVYSVDYDFHQLTSE